MADTKISSYPWLCSTLSGYHDDCYSDAQGLVSDQDAAEQDIATEDAYGKYGLKLVYYAVSKDLERDQSIRHAGSCRFSQGYRRSCICEEPCQPRP